MSGNEAARELSGGRRRRDVRNRQRFLPELLALEQRRLLTIPTFVVKSTGEAGNDSIDAALFWAAAQAHSPNRHQPEIDIKFSSLFDTPQTIDIKAPLYKVRICNQLLSIQGPAGGVTFKIDGAFRGLEVTQGTRANISNITVTGGNNTDQGGGLINSGTLTLTNCNFINNRANVDGGLPGDGGGVVNHGSMNMTNCSISQNVARNDGGAMANFGTAKLLNCTITNNSSTSYGGGGIFNDGKLDIISSTIANNSAGANGGGVYSHGALSIVQSTIDNNAANNYGGGLYISGDHVVIAESTFAGNNAKTLYGGGIYNDANLEIKNSTISLNTAAKWGGGLYNYHSASVSLQNSIVASNTAVNGGTDVYASVNSQGNNLIGSNAGNDGWTNSDKVGTPATR